MTSPLRIMLIAGEPSGDLLGAQLMKSMRAETATPIDFIGVGGEHMEGEGLYSLFPISETSIMGFWEVIPKARQLLGRVKQTAEFAIEEKPDIIVLIDSPGLTHRVARIVRKHAPEIPIVVYVAPQLWASRASRAKSMRKFVDHILALLPFEPDFFEALGLPCHFVGHPVVDRFDRDPAIGRAFRAIHHVADGQQLLCMLPGSRSSEISRLFSTFSEAVNEIRKRHPTLQVVIPTLPEKRTLIEKLSATWDCQPIIVDTTNDKFAAFLASDVAIAASGTVSLELAVARVPTVIGYKIGVLTEMIARRIVTVEHVNLINLVLDQRALPEFIQQECTASRLASEIDRLLSDETARREQTEAMERALTLLGEGDAPPSTRAAQGVLEFYRTWPIRSSGVMQISNESAISQQARPLS